MDRTVGFPHGHPLAEEHVLGGHGAAGIGLHHWRRARPEQIQLAGGLGYAFALAVIIVRHSTRRVGTVLAIVIEGVAELVVLQVAAGVVGISDELIVSIGSSREGLGRGMRRTDHVIAGTLLGKVAPDIDGVLGPPIGGVVPSRHDAVQLVVLVVDVAATIYAVVDLYQQTVVDGRRRRALVEAEAQRPP